MKKQLDENVKKAIVLFDFAKLGKKELTKVTSVIQALRKDYLIINGEPINKERVKDTVYLYYTCTIERNLFDKNKVDVLYFTKSEPKPKKLASVVFK